MSKKKVLFVVDYIKKNYVKENKNTGAIIDTFFDTDEGKWYKQEIRNAFTESGLQDSVEYIVTYAYPQIPEIIKDNPKHVSRIKYKSPTIKDFNKYKEFYINKILEVDPDIVVPLGGGGIKPFFNTSAISKVQGQPEEKEVKEGFNYWFYPSYSPAYAQVKPEVMTYVQKDLRKIGKFLAEGESAFIVTYKNYPVLDNDFDKVIAIFKEAFKHGKAYNDPVAFDYETNSLHAEYEGSKILTISLTWAGQPGVTIPLNHPERPWEPEQQDKLNKMVKLFLDSDLWKVGHNVKFDMRQSKFLIDKDITFKNTLDTEIGYFLGVSQTENKGLKKVAYEFTDQGGYEAPLDEYKDWFLGFLKVVYKLRNEDIDELTEDDYLPTLSESDKEVALSWANKLLDKYGKPNEVRNPADGEKFSYEWIPFDILSRYAAGDTDVTYQINQGLLKQYLEPKPKLLNLYTHHYPMLIDALVDMEVFGIQLDIPRMNEMKDNFDKQAAELEEELSRNELVQKVVEHKEELYAQGLEEKAKPVKERDKEIYKYYNKYRGEEGTKFNSGSKDDMQLVLFGFSGILPPVEDRFLTKKGKDLLASNGGDTSQINYSHFSTGKAVIDWLEENYPDFKLVQTLQKMSKVEKLRTAFTQKLIDLSDSKGVIHSEFMPDRTATGRLASKNPNSQQFPREVNDPRQADYNNQIKTAFVPNYEKGQDTIINIDYSSQEAHLAAVIANDQDMIGSFVNGEDVHKATAALMEGIPYDEVTKDNRTNAKKLTFGLMYGKSELGFADEMGISKEEAEKKFAMYFKGKPKIKLAIDQAQDELKNNGYTEVPLSGFQRVTNEIWSKDYATRSAALRTAFNSKIQGGSAYISTMAVIYVNKWLRQSKYNANLMLTVHDSITISSSFEDAPAVAYGVKYIMTHLPIKELQEVTYKGKKVEGFMDAEIGFGKSYGFEAEVSIDELKSFSSIDGFYEYYYAHKLLRDKHDNHMMSDDEYESSTKELEAKKEYYQAITK